MTTRALVVIDTTFLVDLYLCSRPRHIPALEAARLLKAKGAKVVAPFHSMFEVRSAITNEKEVSSTTGKPFTPCLEANEFSYEGLPIDKGFVANYFSDTLPYLKGADSMYLAVAKKEAAILLTNDIKLIKAAKKCGVDVLTPQEFVERN